MNSKQSKLITDPNIHSNDFGSPTLIENTRYSYNNNINYNDNNNNQTQKQQSTETHINTSHTLRKIIYKGLKNYKMSNYTSLMANSLSSSPQRPFSSLKSLDNQIKILSETNKLTNNNMDNDKGTQLGIGKSNLKEKIKESLKKNIKNGENTFLTGFSSKFIQKKSINSLKSVSIIKEKKDLGDCNRKFEDFWDDLMRKEFIPGKIFLVLENYHFETFKIKSHLKYQFSFISKANFISIKLLIFI